MKKIILIGIGAIALILSLIIILFLTRTSAVDCGTDMECFKENLDSCNLAKVSNYQEWGEAPYEFKIESEIEIKGHEGDKCILYIKTVNFDMPDFPQEALNLFPELANFEERINGADLTCKFTQEQLNQESPEELIQIFSPNEGYPDCEGSFKEIMEDLRSAMGTSLNQD
ncbi:hypothetical protein K9L16_00165 [Candidatus Pacearchaeota archaeon]|nr:hypothetical protein [Candidatus Pacearchaeota archaeon]